MIVKLDDGRRKDVSITEVTAENYIVPANEQHLYHTLIEIVDYDKRGRRMSQPRLQKFGKKIFESNVRDGLKKQGYDLTILYDPTEYLEQHKGETTGAGVSVDVAVKTALKAQEEKHKAEMQKAIDAAVAKALAEMSATAKRGRRKAQDTETETGNDNN